MCNPVFIEARKKALDLLARREHSAAEITRKLSQRGYDHEIVGAVIEDLSGRRYLNEGRFAELWVRQRSEKGFGELAIRAELSQKGVSRNDVDAALRAVNPDWREIALALATRKAGRLEGEDRPAINHLRQKLGRLLQRRGFGAGDIRWVLSRLAESQEDNFHE